jgi:hypothetical protein
MKIIPKQSEQPLTIVALLHIPSECRDVDLAAQPPPTD